MRIAYTLPLAFAVLGIALPSSFSQMPQHIPCNPSPTPVSNCFVQEVLPGSSQPSPILKSSAEARWYDTGNVTGHPYSALAKTEVVHRLSDGTQISQKSEVQIGRDSEGRTVRVQRLNTVPTHLQQSDESKRVAVDDLLFTVINDPIAKVRIEYTNRNKSAAVEALSQESLTSPGVDRDADGNAVFSKSPEGQLAQNGIGRAPMMSPTQIAPQLRSGDGRFEDLGEKLIGKQRAHGTRTRETIAAGTVGNDHEIQIVRESWVSLDLGVVLYQTEVDPRRGRTTSWLENVSTVEPDSSRFKVPEGYTLNRMFVAFSRLSR